MAAVAAGYSNLEMDLETGERGRRAPLVDRLLASKHFGERWGRHWLDVVRYADSQDARGIGGESDFAEAYKYRDWVIDAFNADMPFDQFTRDQLAGDLKPDQQWHDLVASMFHRNTQTNEEGGTDDEEYRLNAMIDRVNTYLRQDMNEKVSFEESRMQLLALFN